jgi:hypothetical protein
VLQRLDRITGRLAEPAGLADGNTLSITQLDEALYKEPSVLTYSAELKTVDQRDCLHITFNSAGSPADPDSLARRITGELPYLFEKGQLLLEIEDGSVGYFTTGTLKRKIMDLRHPDYSLES